MNRDGIVNDNDCYNCFHSASLLQAAFPKFVILKHNT